MLRVCSTLVVICLVWPLAASAEDDPAWKKSFLLSRAGDAFARGRMEDAEKLFQSVLQFDATDDVALLHLGAIARRANNLKQAQTYLEKAVAAHPDQFALRAELGATLLGLKKPGEAAPHFEQATKLKPDNLDAWVNWGDCLWLSGQRESAWVAYQGALKVDPTSTWARRQAGFAAFELGKPEEAIEHLTVARPAFATDANLVLVIGHSQSQLGNDTSALQSYQRAMQLAPKSELGPLFAGTALERMGRVPEAKLNFEQAVALKPDSDTARVHLGNLYRKLHQDAKARAQYAAAIKVAPKSVWALMQLGFLELEAGYAKRAQPILRRAFALAPDNPDIGVAVGDTYQMLGNKDEALAWYQKTLQRHPSNLGALIKTADLLRVTQLEKALTLYAEAATKHPRSAWALISYGDGLKLHGELEAAQVQYSKALDVDPRSVWASRQLGFVEFELAHFPRAQELLEPLAATSQEPDLFLILGHIARRVGTPGLAAAWYEKARTLAPQRATVFLYLGDLYREQHEFLDSEKSTEQALALDPKLVDGWILLGDLRRLRAEGITGLVADELKAGSRQAYEKALGVDPSHHWAQRQLATLAFEIPDDVLAASLLPEVRRNYPKDGELALVAGHLAARTDKKNAALDAYVDATSLLPDDVRPWVFAGRAALALDRFDDAETYFQAGLKIAPQSGWAHLERGFGQRARRNLTGALESARLATTYDEKNSEAWLFLGRLQLELDRVDDAIAAYEKASELAPKSALVDRALASALTHKGGGVRLLRAELLLKRPLEELDDDGFTHAVAGYTLVKLATTPESELTAPQAPQSRDQRRAVWREMGGFELKRAVEKSPADRNLRLAAAVGLHELERFDDAKKLLEPLLDPGDRECPKDEWKWRWNAKGEPQAPKPAETPEQVLALQDEQLRSEAHLLAGDLERDDRSAARLRYFCSLVWMPWRATAHLRLGASYEAEGLVRLAEEHALTALRIAPDDASAVAMLERLRKEGGFPVGPVRTSGELAFQSELVPGDVQARLAQSINAGTADGRRLLLTTPRQLGITADVTWQLEQWKNALRIGASYTFAWGFNSFLNDQLTFEDRRSHLVNLFATGRRQVSDDRRFELWWRAGYRLTVANATTRDEIRNGFGVEARLLRIDWGTLDADLFYAIGLFSPRPGSSIADPTAHGLNFGVRASPILKEAQVDLVVGYRGQVAVLVPSGRMIWVNELSADGRRRWGPWSFGGDLRLGHSSDAPVVVPGVFAFSVMIRGLAAYQWTGYTKVLGRSGVSLVPGNPAFDSFLFGVQGEHRFAFQGFGNSHVGLSLSASYDVRYTWQLGRVEHLFFALVTLGR